jgi:predicted nucleotidyltransferase component of viral defense system
VIAGIRVGALPDLMATKLAAILGRPAIRDYVDLWALEMRGSLPVERGLAFVEERYPRAAHEQTWRLILRALGAFADVRGDPMPRMHGVRLTARQLERYWQARVPQIAAALDDPDDCGPT